MSAALSDKEHEMQLRFSESFTQPFEYQPQRASLSPPLSSISQNTPQAPPASLPQLRSLRFPTANDDEDRVLPSLDHLGVKTRVADGAAAVAAAGSEPTPTLLDQKFSHMTSKHIPNPGVSAFESGKFDNRDMAQIRDKMVQLWNKMSKTSLDSQNDVYKSARVKKVTMENDVVSTGLLTLQEAEERLEIFKTRFNTPYLLIDIIGVSPVSMRKDLPLLFLTVMAISSAGIAGGDKKATSITLQNHMMDAILYEVMILGTQSAELLKCLVLMNLWNNNSESFHHSRSNLLSHICILMAIDLGLGETPDNSGGTSRSAGMRYDRMFKPHATLDPTAYESRVMWLGVYLSSINVSLLVKRPIFLIWSRYTEECCEILERQSERGHQLAAMARMYHLYEEMVTTMQTNWAGPSNISDSRVQCMIQYFENELLKLSKKFDFGFISSSTAYNLIQILLHESVLYGPVSSRHGRMPFSEHGLAIGSIEFTAQTVSAIGWCYSGAVKCIEIIANCSPDEIACLSMFCFSRMAYAVSTLLKIRTLALMTPNFNRICIVSPASLKLVTTIMDKLDLVIEKYPFAHLALNFSFILHVLVFHFDRQLQMHVHPNDSSKKYSATSTPASPDFAAPQDLPNRKLTGSPPIISPIGSWTIANKRRRHQSFPAAASTLPLRGTAAAAAPSIADSLAQHQHDRPELAAARSPLEILSALAVDANRHPPSHLLQTPSPQHLAPLQHQQQPLSQMQLPGEDSEEYPVWLRKDEFWSEVLSGIETMSGFDMF